MSAPAVVGVDRPTLRIRGTAYPVLLPTLRDPRLHLAGVIVRLQVLGQVAFDFQLSIAQILVSLAVAGILEVAIAFRSQRVLMWPASALLTGNGVAFVLRVPGTEHGDWWSMNGWWIFAGTSAIALLSKYLIKVRGRHIFNPSNFGLVLCFLLLGAERADPLALWWGPLSPALVLAIVLIVAGGFAHPPAAAPRRDRGRLLARLRGGHRRARRERPHDDGRLARRADRGRGVLVAPRHVARDPRLPVLHDHRPEDDPLEPQGATRLRGRSRLARDTSDRSADDRVRDQGRDPRRALPRLRDPRRDRARRREPPHRGHRPPRSAPANRGRERRGGWRARLRRARRGGRRYLRAREPGGAQIDVGALPRDHRDRLGGSRDRSSAHAQTIARDVLVDLRDEAEALRLRDADRGGDRGERRRGSRGSGSGWRTRRAGDSSFPTYDVETMQLSLHRGAYQGPPTVVARLEGRRSPRPRGRDERRLRAAAEGLPAYVRLALERGRYRIVSSRAACRRGASAVGGPGRALDGTDARGRRA